MAQEDPLSIRQLQVFVTLIDKGSFTKAARHLGLSQSTVSGHVADLERRLGMRLVGRERTGVTPTGAGEALLRPAREALRGERNARMAAAELRGVLTGTLTLGASTIPAVYLVPKFVQAFRKRHEGITIDVVTGDSSEIVEYVQSGDVDVGVVGTRPAQRSLQASRVATDQLALITPAKHPFRARKSVAIEDLAAESFVLREEGSGTRKAMLDALAPKLSETDLRVVCHVGSTEAVKAAVRAGIGISFVSNLSIADEKKAGTLGVLPVKGLRVQRDFNLVARSNDEISPAGQAFWTETVKA